MNLITAVDMNWGIGYGGKLLFNIPEDMRYFKEKTQDKIVIMGRVTFESLPGQIALKNRRNIVFSESGNLKAENISVCSSKSCLEDIIKQYDTDDVFVIGGQEVYNMLLDYCRTAYITKVYTECIADKFFPNLDLTKNWIIKSESAVKNHNGIIYNFLEYSNENFGTN